MRLSLANPTRLWQEQRSVDPPIDAIGLDWGLYRAGPLVEAEILTPISSRYNGELDAALRRGRLFAQKNAANQNGQSTVSGSYWFLVPTRTTKPSMVWGSLPSVNAIRARSARERRLQVQLLISVPLGNTAKALAVE